MARSPKTPRFEEFNKMPNCFGERQTHKGEWQDYLKKTQSLILEIGCGKADFTLQYAKLSPKLNFVGIDLKADRLWRAAKNAQERKLENVVFIQMHAVDLLERFEKQSIKEIWLTFPDPFPKERQSKHRMSGLSFLKRYHKILSKDGQLNLKTDDKKLYNWSIDQIKESKLFEITFQTEDLHAEDGLDVAKLMTDFENKFLKEGLKINFLRTYPLASRLNHQRS